MSKVTFTKEHLNAVLNMLETQKFADWYGQGGEFDEYITGQMAIDMDLSHDETRKIMIEDLQKMLERG